MSHAKLSASGAKKWINCPLSVELESKIPNEESVYAKEGTKAHELSELKLKRKLNLIGNKAYADEISKLDFDNEMDIIDLKYGKGVEVSAEHNHQLMLYALGTLNGERFKGLKLVEGKSNRIFNMEVKYGYY